MSAPKQQTIGQEAVLEGVGLHTGAATRVRFRPAEPDTGIRFRRIRSRRPSGSPGDARARRRSTDRGTSLQRGEAARRTRWSTCSPRLPRCEIDNVIIEVDGPEAPDRGRQLQAVLRCASARRGRAAAARARAGISS